MGFNVGRYYSKSDFSTSDSLSTAKCEFQSFDLFTLVSHKGDSSARCNLVELDCRGNHKWSRDGMDII
jgi:hypothetical protein